MTYHPDDTIAAIATAVGGAARGMVRISGPDATAVASRSFIAADRSIEQLRQPSVVRGKLLIDLGEIRSGATGCASAANQQVASGEKGLPNAALPYVEDYCVPCDLFLWPTQRSYTREPVAELHTVGSQPILQAALSAACRAGARLAEPGEFTLRAFLSGRLDLTQAEAVLGVIDAAGAEELDAALVQLAGGLARPLRQLREDLLQLLAELEAGLDFVNEDIEFISRDELLGRLASVARALEILAAQMQQRYTAVDLNQVALLGPPNAGKSSLFNALVEKFSVSDGAASSRAPALVSSRRGTTRDYLTATVSFNGLRCELVDTAGIDDTGEATTMPVDAAAQLQAQERRRRASLRVQCVPATDLALKGANSIQSVLPTTTFDLLVITKVDLVPESFLRIEDLGAVDEPIIITSSRTGAGLNHFCDAAFQRLTSSVHTTHNPIVATTAARCGECIRIAAGAVAAATDIVQRAGGDELVAAELRFALAELGKVVGAVYTDDMLDRIFRTFCIGK